MTIAIFSLFNSLQCLPAAIVAPLTSAAALITLVLWYIVLQDMERVTRPHIVGTLLIVVGVIIFVQRKGFHFDTAGIGKGKEEEAKPWISNNWNVDCVQ